MPSFLVGDDVFILFRLYHTSDSTFCFIKPNDYCHVERLTSYYCEAVLVEVAVPKGDDTIDNDSIVVSHVAG